MRVLLISGPDAIGEVIRLFPAAAWLAGNKVALPDDDGPEDEELRRARRFFRLEKRNEGALYRG